MLFSGEASNQPKDLYVRKEAETVVEYFHNKKKIGIQSFGLATLFCVIAMAAGKFQVALGIIIGLSLILFNYLVMGVLIDHAIRPKGNQANSFSSLMAYSLRFVFLMGFLYVLFSLGGRTFGLSVLAGMSLIKVVAVFEVLQISLTDQIYPPNVLPNRKFEHPRK